MNKTELQQKIVDMEKELAELKKELEKKDKGVWKPEQGENYYAINYGCRVGSYTNSNPSHSHFDIGNCYKTQEEAKGMANYIKYTNLLRKYVEEHSEPLDWESNYDKFWISYDYYTRAVVIDHDDVYPNQGTIYASSEEVLEEAIECVGEENIKKHIFGVEE